MRISTSMMFDTGTQNLLQLQTGLYRLQNQMSTGRRVLTPADDPVAAAQALVISQRQSVNAQFMDNQGNAASQLASLESNLGGIGELIQAVKSRAVEAGNGSYSDSDRRTIAAEIRERYEELLSQANKSDAMGQYLFAGFRGDTQPFSVTGTPGSRSVTYNGDEGRRQLQVETGRLMDVSESGTDVFLRIPQGNGQFVFAAADGNVGTGVLGSSSSITGFDDRSYELKFTAADRYELNIDGVLQTNPSPLPAPAPDTEWSYIPGQDITLGPLGQEFKISVAGTPAVNDTFSVVPASNQDLFSTLDKMIKALESGVSATPASRAAFRNQMMGVSENLDQALNHVLGKQTSIGARMLELDALNSAGSDFDLQYKTDISKLVDLDYTQAISDMANQKMVLEAAQLSFKQVSQMSLFSYL